jgi:hypothetical protein
MRSAPQGSRVASRVFWAERKDHLTRYATPTDEVRKVGHGRETHTGG